MDTSPTLTPELENQVRAIALEVYRQQALQPRDEATAAEVGRLRVHMDAQFDRVWKTIDALATVQERTEQSLQQLVERVDTLTVAQQRTEQNLQRLTERVDTLTVAQQRTEQNLQQLTERVDTLTVRVDALADRMEELTQAQRNLTETVRQLAVRIDSLAEGLGRHDKEIGHLTNVFGLDVEEDAEEAVYILAHQKGLRLLDEPRPVSVDGELDVVARVETAEGLVVWLIVEARGRLRRKELGAWARQLQEGDTRRLLEEAGIEPPYLPYMFGRRIYEGVADLAQEMGIGLVTWRGERVPAQVHN